MDVKVTNISYIAQREQGFLGQGLRNIYKFALGRETAPGENSTLVLNKISLQLKPGTVTALMGIGDNCTSLIECIALRQKSGLLAGKIQYDGSVRRNGVFKDIALINDISFIHFDSLTVFDCLYYGARLRIANSEIECRERARLAARVVGLDGSAVLDKLTPGESRVLRIAEELVGQPTLLCLTNPVEGLDAFYKKQVMEILHSLAKRPGMQTTVIYNVSSANDEMLQYADNIGIFYESKLAYFRRLQSYPPKSLLSVFSIVMQVSLIISDANNTEVMGSKSRIEPKRQQYSREQHNRALRAVIDDLLSHDKTDGTEVISSDLDGTSGVVGANAVRGRRSRSDDFYSTSRRLADSGLPIRSRKPLFDEFRILFARSYQYHRRGRLFLRMALFRFVLTGFIIGALIYLDGSKLSGGNLTCSEGSGSSSSMNDDHMLPHDDDYYDFVAGSDDDDACLVKKTAYNVSSGLFILVALSVSGTGFAVPHLHNNSKILKYEVASGLQSTLGSWLSLVLMDIPLYTMASVLVGTILYLMIDIQGSASHFFGTLIITTLTGYSMAAVCAIWSTSRTMASFVFSALAGVFLLFAGYLQIVKDLPVLWKWAANVLYTRYAFESFSITAFRDAESGDEYLQMYNFDDTNIAHCVAVILAWFVVLQVLLLMGLAPPLYRSMWSQGSTGSGGSRNSNKPKSEVDADSYAIMDNNGSFKPSAPLPLSSSSSLASGSLPLSNSNEDFCKTLSILELEGKGVTGEEARDVEQNSSKNESSFVAPALSPTVIQAPNNMRTTLSFQRIKYYNDSISESHSNSSSAGPTLSGISGQLFPGSFTCIFDASGSNAQTLLLRILASKSHFLGKTTGIICANDSRIGAGSYYLNAAFVQRGNVSSVSALTIREVLTYAALLRRTDVREAACLRATRHICWKGGGGDSRTGGASGRSDRSGKDIGDSYANMDDTDSPRVPPGDSDLLGQSSDVDARVSEVLRMTGLDNVADEVIGQVGTSAIYSNGASGKYLNKILERRTGSAKNLITQLHLRCLTLGVELVNRPGLVFLEDPFADLDWYDTEQMCKVLKTLARGGRTVLCSIDKPSQHVFQSFNETLLLGSGLLLYSGPTNAAVAYFENIGFDRSPRQSELEFLLSVADNKGRMRQGDDGTGKRGNALSPQDLSDLNRSLSNIKAGNMRASIGSNPLLQPGDEDSLIYSDSTGRQSSTTAESYRGRVSTGSRFEPMMIDDGSSDQDNQQGGSGPYRTRSKFGSVSSLGMSSRNSGAARIRSTSGSIGAGGSGGPIAVTKTPFAPPIGPVSVVLLLRGIRTLLVDRNLIVSYLSKSLFAGLLLGSVWYKLERGDYESRMSLLATAYIFCSFFVIDALEGIYQRKESFLREAHVEASSYVSYFLSDSFAFQLLFAVGTMVFMTPMYVLAGLRGTSESFISLYFLLLFSVYCNFSLAYVLSMVTKHLQMCRSLFSGAILPLQMMTSGYFVLLSTLKNWNHWFCLICPMSYYMAGAFSNEFDDNDNALGDLSFSDLQNFYSYHISPGAAIGALIMFMLAYRVLYLMLLKFNSVFSRRSAVRKVRGARRKIKRVLRNGFRLGTAAAAADGSGRDDFEGGAMTRPSMDTDMSHLEFNSHASLSTNIYTYSTPTN